LLESDTGIECFLANKCYYVRL